MAKDAGQSDSADGNRKPAQGIVWISPSPIRGEPVAAFEVFGGLLAPAQADRVILAENLALGDESQSEDVCPGPGFSPPAKLPGGSLPHVWLPELLEIARAAKGPSHDEMCVAYACSG